MLAVFKRYGFLGFFRLAYDVLMTRLRYRNARIIRRPFYLRNSGLFSLGNGFTSGVGLRVDIVSESAELKIGKNVQVNDYCHIGVAGHMEIGDGTLIASKVFITDHSHGNIKFPCVDSSPKVIPIDRPLEINNVKIGENVWIGENVQIMPGVSIGSGSVIGASSVVTKDIPENVIVVGSPARVIKKYDFGGSQWLCV